MESKPGPTVTASFIGVHADVGNSIDAGGGKRVHYLRASTKSQAGNRATKILARLTKEVGVPEQSREGRDSQRTHSHPRL